MNELKEKIEKLIKKLKEIEAVLGLTKKVKKIKALEEKSNAPDFWKNQEKARKVMQELEELKKEGAEVESIEREVRDLLEFSEMTENEKDMEDLGNKIKETAKKIEKLEFRTLFSEKYDRSDAILSVYSGAGGVDAQDWAEMLFKMYLKWAQNSGFRAKIVSETRGQEAGIKNATLEIVGSWAYGNLRSEAGVHRLVRLSPFNSDNLRQTSFALVEILPIMEDLKKMEINPNDIKMDTFRSSGAGGQSVNKTSSAVRLTHIPSGIVVACQNERSQMQNREQAMKILRAKLHQKQLEDKEKEKQELRGKSISAEWGSQIRSYVIHPYKMVKDHRTKQETVQVEEVLAGDLKEFQESYLRWIKK